MIRIMGMMMSVHDFHVQQVMADVGILLTVRLFPVRQFIDVPGRCPVFERQFEIG